MKSLISIILPAYNSEKTIKKTIRSVRSQTYKNWELIIIDDDSTDNTYELISQYEKCDNRIHCYKVTHGGAAKARNFGITKATGDYIGFIDADDRYDCNFLQAGMDKFRKKAVDVVVYDFVRVRQNSEYIQNVGTSMFNCYTAVWNKLYSKKLWDSIRFPNDLTIEDVEVVPVVVGKANVVEKVENIFYFYVDNSDSITNNPTVMSSLEIIKAVKLLKYNLKKYQISYDYDTFSKFINSVIYWHLIAGVQKADNKYNVFSKIYSCFEKNTLLLPFDGTKKSCLRKNLVVFLLKIRQYQLAFKFVK